MSGTHGFLSSDEGKTQFRHHLECQVQYFMPFYPSLGPELKQPLRYLRRPEDDDRLSADEKEMSDSVLPFRHNLHTPELLAREIASRSWDLFNKKNENQCRPYLITGGAGSGKTIFSGVLFSELCNMFPATEPELLLFSQLKDTKGGKLWSRVIEGINHPLLKRDIDSAFKLDRAIDFPNRKRVILIIDSLDEVGGFEDELEEVTSDLIKHQIYPVWTCREDNWDKAQIPGNPSLIKQKKLERVKIPRLVKRPRPVKNAGDEWIVAAFSKVPLLYTYKTNFNLEEKLRQELENSLETTLEKIYSKLCENEELKKADIQKNLTSGVWANLVKDGDIPILTDILCESMLEYLKRSIRGKGAKRTLSKIEEFLEKCSISMNKEYRANEGEIDEKTPSKVFKSTQFPDAWNVKEAEELQSAIRLLKHIGLLSQRREDQLRFSHRAFAEYILWKYTPDDVAVIDLDGKRWRDRAQCEEFFEEWGISSPYHTLPSPEQRLRYEKYSDSEKCPDCPYCNIRESKAGKESRRRICRLCRRDVQLRGRQMTVEEIESSSFNLRDDGIISKRDLTARSHYVLHWRKYLTPPYWEEEELGPTDDEAMSGLLNRTGLFLHAVPPISTELKKSIYSTHHDWGQPFREAQRLWVGLAGDLNLGTSEAQHHENSVSQNQRESIEADVNKYKPIQLQGYPGTGKTFSGVEILLYKLTADDVLEKRALILTLNRALSKDIHRDLSVKHRKSKNILNQHSIAEIVDRVDALALEEIFELWAPDLKYDKYVISESDLKNLFEREVEPLVDISHFRPAFTDYSHNMMDINGKLLKPSKYTNSNNSLLKSSIEESSIHQPIETAKKVAELWYNGIKHLMNEKLSTHKACMILIYRLRMLERSLPTNHGLGRPDFFHWSPKSIPVNSPDPGEVINELEQRIEENPDLHFYNMALVDEVQDMPHQAVILTSFLANKRTNSHDLIFSGDHAQALKFDSFDWSDFFGHAVILTDKLIGEIPESHPRKHTHLLHDLLNLHQKEEDIEKLVQNWRNPRNILQSMKDATRWNPTNVPEEEYSPTDSVKDIQSIEAQNPNFGEVIFEQAKSMAEYEESLKDILRHASTNARISIVIADKALYEYAEKSSIDTEVFDIYTIKGLERPTVIVLGGWMVSSMGDHPFIFKNNENRRRPQLSPSEMDRINRRMLVALSRATERSVILIPPDGRRGDSEDPFFKAQENIFVQLPPPLLTTPTSESVKEGLMSEGQDPSALQREYATALFGLTERLDFLKRASDRPTLEKQSRQNRLRVTTLLKQEISQTSARTGSEHEHQYLLTSLFKQIDNAENLASSSLYQLLFENRFSDDESANYPDSPLKIPEITHTKSEHTYLLNRVSQNPEVQILSETLAGLISYAEFQNEIRKAKTKISGRLNISDDYSEEEREEVEAAETKIRKEIQVLLEQISPDQHSSNYGSIPLGIVTQMREKFFSSSEAEEETISHFMSYFIQLYADEEIEVNNDDSTLFVNLTNIAVAIINNPKLSNHHFVKFMESMYPLADYYPPLAEVILFSYLPELGRSDEDLQIAAEFIRYTKVSGKDRKHPLVHGWGDLGLKDDLRPKVIEIESPEASLIRLVNNHPKKEKFLWALIEDSDFLPGISRMSDRGQGPNDLRAALISNIVTSFPNHVSSHRALSWAFAEIFNGLMSVPNATLGEGDDEEKGWQLMHTRESVPGILEKFPLFKRLVSNVSPDLSVAYEFSSLRSTMLLPIMMIRGTRQLFSQKESKKYNHLLDEKPFKGAPPKLHPSEVLEISEHIRSMLQNAIDHMSTWRGSSGRGEAGKVGPEHISEVYYLWAAWLEMCRPRTGDTASFHAAFSILSDISAKYPFLPTLRTSKKGGVVHLKFYTNHERVWENLPFDSLQDYFVETLSGNSPVIPKFSNSWKNRSFWGRDDLSFTPLKISNLEGYKILRTFWIRRLSSRPPEEPLPESHLFISKMEQELFETYITIAKAIRDDLTEAVQKSPDSYTMNQGLFSAIASKLRVFQDMSIKQGISIAKLNENLINRGATPTKIDLVPRPIQDRAGLGPGGLSQRWGRTNNGFVIDMLEMMGLAFDDSNRLHHEDISVSEMNKFIEELEDKFGYTVQQQTPSKIGVSPKVYRGSREKSGHEVLFHGTRRSCLDFLKAHDNTIRSSETKEGRLLIEHQSVLLQTNNSLLQVFPEIYATNEVPKISLAWLGGKYTLQENEEDKVTIIRNSKRGVKSGFEIIFSGSYTQCLEIKQVFDYPDGTQ